MKEEEIKELAIITALSVDEVTERLKTIHCDISKINEFARLTGTLPTPDESIIIRDLGIYTILHIRGFATSKKTYEAGLKLNQLYGAIRNIVINSH